MFAKHSQNSGSEPWMWCCTLVCNPSTWEVGGPENPLHPHYRVSSGPAWISERDFHSKTKKRKQKPPEDLGASKADIHFCSPDQGWPGASFGLYWAYTPVGSSWRSGCGSPEIEGALWAWPCGPCWSPFLTGNPSWHSSIVWVSLDGHGWTPAVKVKAQVSWSQQSEALYHHICWLAQGQGLGT